MPLHARILLGLVAGALAGGLANAGGGENASWLKWVVDQFTEPVGQLFLRLLLLLVVPLVFSSLTLGVAGIGDIRKIGRVGIKSLAYTLVVSAISVVIGLVLANTIKPGKRLDPAVSQRLQERYCGGRPEDGRSDDGGGEAAGSAAPDGRQDDRADQHHRFGREGAARTCSG